MKYKDILGYSKPKKKVIKEEVYKPTLTEELTKEFGPLTERKLDSKYVQKVAKYTDKNNHTQARIFLSHMMRNKKLLKFYNAMSDLRDVFGGFDGHLSKVNQNMEKELYKQIKKQFSNAKEIIGAL